MAKPARFPPHPRPSVALLIESSRAVGIKTSRCFAENFANHEEYAGVVEAFLKTGRYEHRQPKPFEIAECR